MRKLRYVLAAVSLLGLTGCHAMTCDVGHYETVRVPAHQELTPIFGGKDLQYAFTWVPDHDEQHWRCDHVFNDKGEIIWPKPSKGK